MRNEAIREYAKEKGVKLWEIADAMGITDSTLSRQLRHELEEAARTQIFSLVDQIVAERERSVK